LEDFQLENWMADRISVLWKVSGMIERIQWKRIAVQNPEQCRPREGKDSG